MDIIVWQKVKTHKTPPSFINVDIQKCCSQVLTVIFFCYNIDNGEKGDILGLF